MTIAATQSLGPAGSSDSRPTTVAWKWYYHAGGVPLWTLIALLVIGPQANHHRQAWLIFVPLAAVALFSQMLTRLFAVEAASAELFGIVTMSCAMAWAAVWVFGHRLGALRPAVRFATALAVMLTAGTVSCWAYLGLEDNSNLLSASIFQGVVSLALLVGMTLAGLACDLGFRRGRFLWCLYAFIALGLAVCSLVFVAAMLLMEGGRGPAFAMVAGILYVAVVCPILAGILFLFQLPFMLLALNAPFYRARFHAMFCREAPPMADDPAGRTLRYSPPLSTDPTRKPVGMSDVVGRWQFYLDEASSTVVVDFRADGTFVESVIANRGGEKQYAGGSWELQGPLVQLTGYVAASDGGSHAKTWWMVDTAEGITLFGGETTFFALQRRI